MLLRQRIQFRPPSLAAWPRIIDRLVQTADGNNGNISLTWFLTFAALIPLTCVLGRLALSWFSSGRMNHISLQFVRALTDSLHRKLQRLPLAYFDRQETGQLMARLTNDVGTLLIFLGANSLPKPQASTPSSASASPRSVRSVVLAPKPAS
ncbi:MAG: hypothetical protein JF612_03985 [Planctomycetia bacterium]|nr:hypothetical protein [Planctomycetia bacterium]